MLFHKINDKRLMAFHHIRLILFHIRLMIFHIRLMLFHIRLISSHIRLMLSHIRLLLFHTRLMLIVSKNTKKNGKTTYKKNFFDKGLQLISTNQNGIFLTCVCKTCSNSNFLKKTKKNLNKKTEQ